MPLGGLLGSPLDSAPSRHPPRRRPRAPHWPGQLRQRLLPARPRQHRRPHLAVHPGGWGHLWGSLRNLAGPVATHVGILDEFGRVWLGLGRLAWPELPRQQSGAAMLAARYLAPGKRPGNIVAPPGPHPSTPQNKLDSVGEAIDGEAQALDARRVEALERGGPPARRMPLRFPAH